MEKQERSDNTSQTDQIITRDCYVRLLLTQNYAENVAQNYILFNKIFCKMKQKVSNILFLMYSAQFIKFKGLVISVKKVTLKKHRCPCFIKHGDRGLVPCLHSLLDIFQQLLLKIFDNITLKISNWSYLVLLPPPRKAKQGREHLVVYPQWLQQVLEQCCY